MKCGYDVNSCALEFHHVGDKEFEISDAINKSWEFLKKELDKCILLCSNCHRIEHSLREDPVWVLIAKNYNGKLLL